MKQIKSTLAFIAGLALCLSVSASTQAATITQTKNLDDGAPLIVSLAQFDPSLGVLNSVTLDLETTYERTLTAEKIVKKGSAQIIWAFNPYTIAVSSGGQTLDSDSGTSPQISLSFSLNNGQGFSHTRGVSGTIDNSFAFSNDLSPFIGTGLTELLFSVNFNDLITGDMNAVKTSLGTVFSNGKLMATMDYTPAPLPSALIFLISGLAAVAGFKRFKAARA